MQVSKYGFGAAPIGNLFSAVDDDEARAAVDAAYDAGIRLFDTAPHYGLGLSERRLGAALAGRPRDSYTLSTKVGRLLVPAPADAPVGRDDEGFDVPADLCRVRDYSRDGVRRSLEESLERLGLDAVDIVLIHDPDAHWEQAVSEAYPALAELRDQGVVKAVGVGMNQAAMLARFVRETGVDTVMLAGRYTLLDQSGEEELLPLCRERGVSVLAAGVFNSGLLATHDPSGTYDYAPAPGDLLARARRIASVCERHGVTLPQAALAFPLRHPAVVSVVVGARSAAEVTRNAALTAAPVPDDLWAELAAEGLIG
ncbi:D-threo-aldose 1-dehydrogenase [Streptosporangium becharense]|uniref:D-threo-aldose 1-dehydrogenase n=1 Tax=Streptosporangium becharense TaxID=1816182 RepID=A0A7W9MHV6_9ACTN|nr:aldo/keto reductase [Streptosporangium becharense]MBB2913989.1 D-threo-aldose 1-dehydrogenase [Streptosporangium becharense]MBB5821350.1 D-threo-aldose 1-dehydrogenase [Streptosporangium becharense]